MGCFDIAGFKYVRINNNSNCLIPNCCWILSVKRETVLCDRVLVRRLAVVRWLSCGCNTPIPPGMYECMPWYMVTRDVFEVLELHPPTACAIWRTSKTSLVSIYYEMHSRLHDFLYKWPLLKLCVDLTTLDARWSQFFFRYVIFSTDFQ